MSRLIRERLGSGVFFLLLVLLPSQLGKHFWLVDSYLQGVRVDYLSPTLYVTDLLVILLLGLSWPEFVRWFNKTNWRINWWLVVTGLLFLNIGLSERVVVSGIKLLKIVEWWVLVELSVIWVKKSRWSWLAGLSLGLAWTGVLVGWQMMGNRAVGGWWYYLGERRMSVLTPGVVTRMVDGVLSLVPYASFSHPNVMAGFAALALVVLAIESRRRNSWQWLARLGCGVAVGLLVFSWSQAGWLAWFLASLLFGFIPKQFRMRVLLGLMVLSFGVTAWVLSRPKLALVPYLSVSSRVELNRAGMEVFYTSPLFGQGLGNTAVLVNKDVRQSYTPAAQPAHHLLIIWLYELGLVFLAAILVGLLVFAEGWRGSRLVGVIAVVFGVTGSLDHYWWTQQQTWLLGAMVVGWLIARKQIWRL